MLIESTRLQRFETLIFQELAKRKKEKIAKGETVIDLSIGSPDQPAPSFIKKALIEAIEKPSAFQYTLTGLPSFNEAVASFYKRKYGVSIDPSTEVMQTMGSQDALVHLPLAFMNEGDVVLLPDPGYTAYEAAFKIAGATIYPMPLLEENHFLPDLSAIPESVAKKAKMMVLNFPGNPVPVLAPKSFYEQVVHFAKEHEILVVHDFAYSELIFEGKEAVSFLSIPDAKDVGIECNSLSKSFNMAGCRVGYIIGNETILTQFSKLKSHLDYGVFEPIQHAATTALLHGDDFLVENNRLYEERRNVLVNGLQKIGWNVATPDATMFVWAKIPATMNSVQFTFDLLEQTGVVVTPGSAFGTHGEGYVRIALVERKELLAEAVQRISHCFTLH
ncbi:LL-diaminopimelate aminotransferase [Bacillus sp. FJAT-47783]|uniref:LL-diaminopimelate aminotransferase n=1 Tax=Bacillus sp. FJAT-47783 TaxID=2922712 RepID=UPI001FABDCD0|nr:LL-diaminopimelate aminotransferase [Bacillus sp. FJAT-47783]